ncbi:enoyl-CoA hydratase [Halobacteriales archaeon QS_4_69_34]|nr:MAG: enoyl-CoA hydratase [Halobacteriales archaeon QS_4_69_34]
MPQTEYENFDVTRSDGIIRVVFNSSAGRNALHLEMANEFISLATDVSEDPNARCVVFTHEGDFYGTGADLSPLDADERDALTLRRLAGRLHEAIVQFHTAETPIVGGIDGVAAGAGFSLAIMPDLVLVSDEARLNYAYPNIGMTGDGGSTFWLPRLVGLRKAKEITLLDEPIGPEEAVDLGLANEIVSSEEFDHRLDELAHQLAAGPTHAMGVTKQLLTESFNKSIEEQLAAETESIADAARTEDYARGLSAFLGDDEPDFVGR